VRRERRNKGQGYTSLSGKLSYLSRTRMRRLREFENPKKRKQLS